MLDKDIMEEFSDRSSEKYREIIEDIKCPFCEKAKITVIYIPGYKTWSTSRAGRSVKRTPFYHDPKIKVHCKCPNCGKSKEEIKHALKIGSKPKSHEERLKRLKESGLPTKIVSERK